jgi:hypothetical protein
VRAVAAAPAPSVLRELLPSVADVAASCGCEGAGCGTCGEQKPPPSAQLRGLEMGAVLRGVERPAMAPPDSVGAVLQLVRDARYQFQGEDGDTDSDLFCCCCWLAAGFCNSGTKPDHAFNSF